MFSVFQREIAQAARASFEDLRTSHAGERFYAYALYTDSGAMTVVPAASSYEALAIVRRDMEIADDESASEFQWHVGDWRYESWKAANFGAISSRLRCSSERINFSSFARQVHADMIAALRLLDSEGFFGCGVDRNEIVLFVSISDDDDAIRLENESAKELNPPTAYERFLKRYD